ncbi:MAG: hypothetical protein LW707_05350 [Sphingobacteriales bacterium]|nr:hypothetical protein [Sphingobacteriales bacterium]
MEGLNHLFSGKGKAERLLFALLFATSLVILGLRVVLATSYLPETGGVSINVVYGVERILHGENLYADPEKPPFPIIQYMPLHFKLVQLCCNLFMIGESPYLVSMTNRFVCLGLDIICMSVIAIFLIRIIGLRALWGWILAFIYFVSLPSIVYARADNLYLLFFTLATCLILRYLLRKPEAIELEAKNSLRNLFGAGTLAALALFTKQTGIFLPCFATLYLLAIESDKKAPVYFLGGLGVTSLLLVFVADSGSLLEMKLNVVDGLKNGISFSWFAEVILKNYFLKYSFLLAAGFLIAFQLLQHQHDRSASLFIGGAMMFFFCMASLAALKAGSGSNYYLEFIILLLLGAGVLLRHNHELPGRFTLYASALLPFFMIASANDKGWGDLKKMEAAKSMYKECEMAAEYIRPRLSKDEWVLTDFHKENHLNLMLCDKALFPCREVAVDFTWPKGVFNFNAFGRLHKEGKIRYYVCSNGNFPTSLLNVSMTGFDPDTTIGTIQIYRYNQ